MRINLGMENTVMPDVAQSREVQQMAIQVVVGGITRTAAKYCNTSMATIEKWARGEPISTHAEVSDAVIKVAKKGLRRALDEHNIV